MDIGLLNEKVIFQKNTVIIDSIGNHKNGWEDFYTCYATIGGEGMASSKEKEETGTIVEDVGMTVRVGKMQNLSLVLIRFLSMQKLWLISIRDMRFMTGMESKVYPEVTEGATSGMTNADCPFMVKVSIPNLNIRKGAGTNTAKTGIYTGVGVFTIMEVKSGKGSDAGWGRLKSGAGWISLDYCQRM